MKGESTIDILGTKKAMINVWLVDEKLLYFTRVLQKVLGYARTHSRLKKKVILVCGLEDVSSWPFPLVFA